LASGDFFGHIFLVKLAIKQPTTQPSPQTISVIGLIPDKSGLPSQTMRIYQKEPKSTFRCTKNFKEGIIFKRKKSFYNLHFYTTFTYSLLPTTCQLRSRYTRFI